MEGVQKGGWPVLETLSVPYLHLNYKEIQANFNNKNLIIWAFLRLWLKTTWFYIILKKSLVSKSSKYIFTTLKLVDLIIIKIIFQ